MKKVLLISNPVAGRLGSRTAMFDVIEQFCKKGYDVNVAITQYRMHAMELARSAKEKGFDIVVCAGGDGTVRETICGLLQTEDRPFLGYIPCGTTNDFGETLGLSMLPAHAAKAITNETPSEIDIGKFNNTNFAYVASFGAFTSISYSVPQDLKNSLGYLAYLIEGLKDITNIKPYKMHLSADGQEFEGEYIFGSISNSTSVAKLLHPENVDLNDGAFELLLVRKPENAIDLNRIITGIMSSDFSGNNFIYKKAKEIHFDMEKPIPWTLDGEKYDGSNTIDIYNLHSAIKILK